MISAAKDVHAADIPFIPVLILVGRIEAGLAECLIFFSGYYATLAIKFCL